MAPLDAMLNLPSPDKTNLLQLAGAAPVIVEVDTVHSRRELRDTVPQQTVGTQLRTPQKIWSGNQSAGTIDSGPSYTNIVNNYFTSQRVENVLRPFRWIRATIKLRVLFRASASLYGAAYTGWYYGKQQIPDAPFNLNETWGIATSGNCHFVDLAGHQEIEMTIPWRSALEFRATTDSWADYISFFFNILDVESLEPAAPKGVDYEVWMHLEDVELSGYIDAQSQPKSTGFGLHDLPAVASFLTSVPTTTIASLAYDAVHKRVYGDNAPKEAGVEHKPPSSQENTQTPVVFQQYGNIAALHPIPELQTIGDVGLNKIPSSLYGDDDYHLISDLISIPCLLERTVFTTTGQEYKPAMGPLYLAGWAKEMAQHFRFYRGRQRLVIDFITSPLMSARFQIEFHQFNEVYNSTDSGKPTQTVEVKGSTRVVVETPFVSQRPVAPTEGPSGWINIRLLAAPIPLSSGGLAKVMCYIHSSLTPDTEFYSIRETPLTQWYVPPPPPVAVEGQAALREMRHIPVDFDMGTGPLTPLNHMTPIKTVEEIMARWSNRYLPSSTSGITTVLSNDIFPSDELLPAGAEFVNNQFGDNVDKIAPLFALWRGSRDFRTGKTTVSTTSSEYADAWINMSQAESLSYLNGPDPGNGGCLVAANEINQFRVPFLSPYLVANASNGTQPPYQTNSNLEFSPSAPTKTTCISRAGPDFQLFYPNRLYRGSAAYVDPSYQPTFTVPP